MADRFGDFAARDLLTDIRHYSKALTVSQVVKFFERQNIRFTKTMIQNYVRVGLLPPPADKRFYHSGHLAMLAMIDPLKDVLRLEGLKAFFQLSAVNFDRFDTEQANTLAVYQQFLSFHEAALRGAQDLPNEPFPAAMRAIISAGLYGKIARSLIDTNLD